MSFAARRLLVPLALLLLFVWLDHVLGVALRDTDALLAIRTRGQPETLAALGLLLGIRGAWMFVLPGWLLSRAVEVVLTARRR